MTEEGRFDDNWGTIDRLLAEFGPMVPVLTQGENSAESLRAFTRWFFGAFEVLAHALKKIAVAQAQLKKVELSTREQQVLQIVQEPAFPGLPPPRRVEAPLREGLTTAIRVFARARSSEAPLNEGRLPKEFIEATVLFDRISRPSTGDELNVSREDFLVLGKTVLWFRELQQWLYRERLAEIEEVKISTKESFEAMRRKLEQPPED